MRVILATLMLLASIGTAHSISPITINAVPRVGIAPQDIRVRLRIEKHEFNIGYVLSLEGPNYSRRTDWPLDGSSRAVTEIWYRDVPAGDYTIEAVLIRRETRTVEAGRAFGQVRVIGEEPI